MTFYANLLQNPNFMSAASFAEVSRFERPGLVFVGCVEGYLIYKEKPRKRIRSSEHGYDTRGG
jgi:hypothetical protein